MTFRERFKSASQGMAAGAFATGAVVILAAGAWVLTAGSVIAAGGIFAAFMTAGAAACIVGLGIAAGAAAGNQPEKSIPSLIAGAVTGALGTLALATAFTLAASNAIEGNHVPTAHTNNAPAVTQQIQMKIGRPS